MWWYIWCIMYVHIKAVTYVTFPNKQDFLPKLIRQKYKRKCKTRIYSYCIMFVMYYLANWIWLWTMLVEKCRQKIPLPCEKRITKTQELWTNKWCLNALCIEILMIYGIINLLSHMHFFRYFDAFTIHSGVSFPLVVWMHAPWTVYKNPFLINGYISLLLC